MTPAETPWTPGPWHVESAAYRDMQGYRVDDEDCNTTLSAFTGREADARLIARAPEMAELLRTLLADTEDEGVPLLPPHRAGQISALLDAIKGGA